ncbi:hypothetical protein J8848_19560 [Klebsiella pneumoniae]|uniref:hypothetical protein n=1 Tax=Klebsiella pneumoniae TaxID=573 RepID=UPI0024478355|nr:hypothetical protein [Klebsiella pneumoniae]MDX4491253.1 hypothetical protein [Klebsiella pneumoniae]WGG76290.1 hypothetical protein P9M40_09335 [Klebsiella pneumoniae subsp. pneumoniae]WGG81835.1 hypothetical protein P9M41_09330 [Klebsiella pneumoniae subsp. pneumoniae]HDE1160689.1 hypothetical protein [Klebsiella pneumoniae]HDG5273068.1 hypothetical protein [Klebsiella pneumoniae]
MTITLQAVNELIASLESAGELSIREQKFLKLAKEFRICSASLDTVIKTGNVLADQNSQLAAENVALKESRNNLAEFIHEELDADYPLNMNLETHATDRFVAGIKADGVGEFIGRLQQHVDEGDFVGDEVAVIVGAIDCGKEFFEQLREGADK